MQKPEIISRTAQMLNEHAMKLCVAYNGQEQWSLQVLAVRDAAKAGLDALTDEQLEAFSVLDQAWPAPPQ